MSVLRLVLGDQLTEDISSLRDADRNRDLIVMAEVSDEATYVKHHKKKIAFLFSAMRHHAKALESCGYAVSYHSISDTAEHPSLESVVQHEIKERADIQSVVVTAPGEWRLMEAMKTWGDSFGVSVEIREDDRFICTHQRFDDWADGRKTFRMEHFYREMRKETGLLMEGDEPCGGEWNFDKDNRKSLPKSKNAPPRRFFQADDITKAVLKEVEERFGDHFGDLEGFDYAVCRDDAEAAFDHFIEDILPLFGDYQDAMAKDEPWLWHSLISMYINCGLLDPLECCQRAEEAYKEGRAPINAVEGFIRQILGWREYVRGIYWRFMPDYRETNALNAKRPLPEFYWSGETDMKCLSQVIGQTKQHAYAHHIQRLMVTGNFALLAGIDPEAVNEWYLLVYADAYEWVELPNTHGMALYADNGVMASKPYAASGSYINRMSDYCKSCTFDVKTRDKKDSCPFNYLFWDFMARHEKRLRQEGRMGLIYSNFEKIEDKELKTMRELASDFLNGLE